MKVIKGSLFSLILFSLGSVPNGDCTVENFVGTWKGKVEFQGDELAQGPYVFALSEDRKSLHMTDETGAKFEVAVSNCEATISADEEGMKMKTIYTYEGGLLQILSLVEFPDDNGEVVKTEMKGSLSKVD